MLGGHHQSKLEIAEHFVLSAAAAAGDLKERRLDIANLYNREAALIQGSRRAIAESKMLIGAAERLLR
jgi:hypothetical protein